MTASTINPNRDKLDRSNQEEARLAEKVERLEETLSDLAKDQRHLHEQIAQLADHLDQLLSSNRTQPDAPALPMAPPKNQDAAWRSAGGGDLKSLLRSLLRRGRALWQATDPIRIETPKLIVDQENKAVLPDLAIVFRAKSRQDVRSLPPLEALEKQTFTGSEWLFWDHESGRVRVEDPSGRHLRDARASSVEDLRQTSEARYFLTFSPALALASPTLLELALLALAVEPLAFVEVPTAETSAPLLVVERELWHPSGIDDQAFKRKVARHRGILGKILPVQGIRGWHHRPAVPRGWGQVGPYIIADPLRGRARQPLRMPRVSTWPAAQARPCQLILVEGLVGGVERWIVESLRAHPEREAIIALLQPSDPLTKERSSQLEKLKARIYPLADLLPQDVHAPVLDTLRQKLDLADVLDLRPPESPEFPNLPTRRLDGAPASYCKVDPAPPESDRSLLKRRLGLPEDCLIASQIDDLIAIKRPEDFLALAHYLRDDERFFFVLAGRGPLMGTVQDLARFYALENFRLITTASNAEILHASDVILSMAETDPWPYNLLEARERGRPVLSAAEGVEDENPQPGSQDRFGRWREKLSTLWD